MKSGVGINQFPLLPIWSDQKGPPFPQSDLGRMNAILLFLIPPFFPMSVREPKPNQELRQGFFELTYFPWLFHSICLISCYDSNLEVYLDFMILSSWSNWFFIGAVSTFIATA